MNVYTYNIRNASNGQKLIGGTMHATDMESALLAVIKRSKLAIRKRVGRFWTDTDFMLDERKVYLHLGVHPECVLDPDSKGIPVTIIDETGESDG